jgi:transposase
MGLWHYRLRGWARRAWQSLLSWAAHSRLEPIRKVAAMLKTHLGGILNAVVLRAHNGGAESINSRIKTLKLRARGYRNPHSCVAFL